VRIVVPGRRTYDIDHVVLDLNGTIGLDGALIEGVSERLSELRARVHVAVVTADTHGGAGHIAEDLRLETTVLQGGDQARQKLDFVRGLEADRVVAIGNGANDVSMLKESAIGICVVGPEGASSAALLAADVVVTDVRDALDLLLKPRRLAATLRT